MLNVSEVFMKMYYVAEVLDWFENISLCWNDVTISSLEACDFKRVDA